MPMKIAKTDPLDERSGWASPLRHARRLYITFFQGLFSHAPRGQYRWDENPETTEIVITDEMPLSLETLGDRPGITFTRAPVSFSQLGFDDMLQQDARTGRKTKSLLVPGTMLIHCCARVHLESEHLAFIAAEHLWLLRDLLMKAGFYDVGRNLSIGVTTQAGEIIANDQGEEWYSTTITSPFYLYRTSEFTPLNQPIVHGISAKLGILPPQPVKPPTVPAPPENAGLPYQVQTTAPEPVLPVQEGQKLPLLPHPLNPAQLVHYRPVGASGGLRPPAMGGRRIPIVEPNMGSSDTTTTPSVNVKVKV